jgi:hypothetical protein
VNADQLAQYLDDATGADAPSHVDRQTLAGELIDHRQALELLTVGAGVEYRIIGPYWPMAIGGNGRGRLAVTRRRGRFLGTCSLYSRQRRGARSVLMTAARQEDLDAPIAVSWVLRRQLVHRGYRGRISLREARLVPHGGSRHAQQRARSPMIWSQGTASSFDSGLLDGGHGYSSKRDIADSISVSKASHRPVQHSNHPTRNPGHEAILLHVTVNEATRSDNRFCAELDSRGRGTETFRQRCDATNSS